jgi:hypothetical protein
MEVIDKILNEWSFRCHDGIVNMNDPKKKAILVSLLEEQGLSEDDLKEANIINHDDVIKKALNVEEIPQVQGSYKLGEPISLNSEDAKVFEKLYPITPPKKGQNIDSAGSKGSGNGEIAVYWLFAHQPGHTAEDKRGRGNPDLIVDGIGVEIKALDGSKKIAIGRIGSYTESLKDLNVVMGIDALSKEFQSSGKKQTPPNAFNATIEDIIQACKHSLEIYNNDELREIGKVFNIDFISSMYDRLDKLIEKYSPKSPEEFAADILKGFIIQKFLEKPGVPGYIINVSPKGELNYTKINQEKIDNLDTNTILNNAELRQGALVFKSDLF